MTSRRCSRAGCHAAAVATLTYVYAESTAVLGPLATYAEPHSYDLCAHHALTLTAPLGWEVIRLDVDLVEPRPATDDLEALADAVREVAGPTVPSATAPTAAPPTAATTAADGASAPGSAGAGKATGRAHLRVVRTPTS